MVVSPFTYPPKCPLHQRGHSEWVVPINNKKNIICISYCKGRLIAGSSLLDRIPPCREPMVGIIVLCAPCRSADTRRPVSTLSYQPAIMAGDPAASKVRVGMGQKFCLRIRPGFFLPCTGRTGPAHGPRICTGQTVAYGLRVGGNWFLNKS